MTRESEARDLAADILMAIEGHNSAEAMTALTLAASVLLTNEGKPERSNQQLAQTMANSVLLVLNSIRPEVERAQ